MILLKANSQMLKDNLEEKEKELTEKIGEKVVIIPCTFEVIQLEPKRKSLGRKIW